MGKKQEEPNHKNKKHKTLRDKLRKKREQLKKHKKEKSEKHKQYNSEQQKRKFFEQNSQPRKDGIKQHKLNKYINKFVDIYEDDVEDFYDLFDNLDQGGNIDIAGVADPKMQKCLIKMFKYLPLKKDMLQYDKAQGTNIKLRVLIKELVTKAIDRYMQDGTEEEQNSAKEGSDQEDNQKTKGDKEKEEKKQNKKKKDKKDKKGQGKQEVNEEQIKKKKVEVQHSTLREYEKLNLYPGRIIQTIKSEIVGPYISEQQRQMLAQMCQQQEQVEPKQMKDEDNQDFDRIFSMSVGSGRRKKVQGTKPCIDDIPDDLLAEGSAKIGQKQYIDPQEIEEYNKIHRPRKLIEEHQQMLRIGKYADKQKDGTKKRVPFDRERDIVYGRSRQPKNEGVFYDFSQRMTKPKSTNSFL